MTTSASLVSLFLLGLSGTGHCIGMCGPLVFAFPGKTGGLNAHLCYHLGRIATYTLAGFFLGACGLVLAKAAALAGFDHLGALARVQLLFSFTAGAFLLLFGLAQLGVVRQPEWLSVSHPGRIPGYRLVVRGRAGSHGAALMFVTGAFMGFLPCGLSFAAFSRALAASRPLEGAALLFAFGLGTLPGLLLLGTGVSAAARRYRRHFDLFSGMLMIGMAAALLVDGVAALV